MFSHPCGKIAYGIDSGAFAIDKLFQSSATAIFGRHNVL